MKRKRFEYKKVPGNEVCYNSSIKVFKLDEYGDQGWELVTFTWVNQKVAFAYFKRQIYDR